MKRIGMIILIVMVSLLAAGCDYPSDTEQIKKLEKAGFTNCDVTTSSDWLDNTAAICDYTSGDGKKTCRGKVGITDSGKTITSITRIKCEDVEKENG